MSPAKILYVEDEPNLGKIVRESLEARAYVVEMVEDGARVMEACRQFRPDICVLDVMLPHQDGFSVARELRMLMPDLPIMFLTAKTQTQDLLTGFAAGGNDYLRKPFSLEELMARIENILTLSRKAAGRADTGETSIIRLGQYQLWLHKYQLVIGDKVRDLSHREAQLLHILLSQPNRPIARKDILLSVWGDDSFFNSRNLDVYITRIREYLRDDPAIRILTLKGVGYHVSVE
ncbi:MAG: response regulator transcription factor [Bacteroidia bacterium]|nr:response regulator transcription factor [Bacteroidia bacterium]